MSENKTTINWFPGHMTKALRMMEEEVKKVDVVIYVLDSRAPFSSVNPSFINLIKTKSVIYVFNKSDLVEKDELNKFLELFTTENSRCIALNSRTSGTSKDIKKTMQDLCKKKIEKNTRKGVFFPLRAMVIGVPNSGKSTLINNLCGQGKTITGNRPGVTKGKQWVKIDDYFEIMDTPGTLWPNLENDIVAHNLVYIGSIKDDILELQEIGFDFIKFIVNKDKTILETRYNIKIEPEEEILDIFNDICLARKFVLRKNDYDYERCAKALLSDFREGKLGKIILDDYSKIVKN